MTEAFCRLTAALVMAWLLCAAPDAAADSAPSPLESPGTSAAGAASAASGALAAPATGAPAVVRQPRSFGHVLGDVLAQRVLLPAPVRSALPAADRVGVFLERRTPRVEPDDQGRSWLVLEYQVVNAPRSLTAVTLPALSLNTASGVWRVAPWPVSIGPITPPETFNQGELQALRPDRPVTAVPLGPLERSLKAAVGMLAGVLAAWAAWWAWRNVQESHRLPFAKAWRRVRRLDPGDPQAWLALHQALNATAGRVVHGRTLGRLLAEAPHLQPLAAPLEAFFGHSEQRFFATAAAAALPALDLRALGLALRDAERRHHA